MVQYEEMSYKNKANTISIDQAKEDYKELIADAIDKKMWLKCRNIKNVWVSPFEIQEAWLVDKYLWPVSYWELENPNNYLRTYSEAKRKADQLYNYAHKRYQVFVKNLDLNMPNI
jgi:hypothetical protein